jgi:hypothetical protein
MSAHKFMADDADIILRASRSDAPREFRVHKTILSIMSPIFKDMFNIPQPGTSTNPAGSTISIIDVDDTPEDLEIFLRMIYPLSGFPPMSTLNAISHAFAMIDKYEVQGLPLQHLKFLLVSPEFLKEHPIQVYAIACGWKLKEEADIAAPHTSSLDVLLCARDEDIARMTGPEYHRILMLGKKRRSACEHQITQARVTCNGCRNYKNFYPSFRSRLLTSFKDDHRPFYDYGRCVVRCFEIAVETEADGVEIGCGLSRDSHVGRFIRTLAETLSSNT